MLAAVLALLPTGLAAQSDVEMVGRMLSGTRPPQGFYDMVARDRDSFKFSETNGWIRRGERVARTRRLARASLLGGPQPAAQAHVVDGIMRGDLNLPVFLAMYTNTDSAAVDANFPRDSIAESLYGDFPGPKYSIRTLYREISNDSLRVNGTVLAWTRVDSADSWYEGSQNGLWTDGNIPALIRELVQAHDDTVDFGQFDNDGPDGVPNSGDDDGVVDGIMVVHAELDGACGGNGNIWAHKYSYGGWTGSLLSTQDPSNAPGATFIRINDYVIGGGQGGSNGCTANQPVNAGVLAHEAGHLIGLPDLYDTSGGDEGIGYWGLMGSGNWNDPFSPANLSAWAKADLGWITEVLVDRNTVLDIGPVITSDTAYVVPINSSNEYFLLENRQAIGSDAPISGTGLLIWHVDSVRINGRRPSNAINAFEPKGLALEQADGRDDLQNDQNRGDAGDPFPGATNKAVFGPTTNPSTARNDGSPTHLTIDSIGMIAGTLRMRARVLFPGRIAASDTTAVFRLDGSTYQVFNGSFDAGSTHTLDIDSVQLGNGDRSRYAWLSWSNGQARTHTFIAAGSDTITAEVEAEHRLLVGQQGTGGAVTAAPSVDAGGTFFPAGTPITLTADVTSAGHVFEGWVGDTVAFSLALQLDMQRPYDVTARFAEPLVITEGQPAEAVMGGRYEFAFEASGGLETKTWSLVNGPLPSALRLQDDGTLVGEATETGAFPFTVKVISGSQQQTIATQLVIAAPAMAVGDVVAEVTNAAETLTNEERRYLDLIGNENGRVDVGDFLAWVETTGGAVSAATIRRVLAEAAEGQP
jgi:M6 family metalloprotease-like protein